MKKKYRPDLWELESLLDSTKFEDIFSCVDIVESQLQGFDDRNDTDHSTDLSSLVQASFLTAAVAQMEHHLKKVCDVLAELRSMDIRVQDLKGANGFESCLTYLKKALKTKIPEDKERAIRSVVKVRNVLVHEGGYTPSLPADLGDLAQHLRISANESLAFTGPFTQHACLRCREFVEIVVGAATAGQAQWKGRKRRARS